MCCLGLAANTGRKKVAKSRHLIPWDDLREIFSGCQRMARVPNAVEILPKS